MIPCCASIDMQPRADYTNEPQLAPWMWAPNISHTWYLHCICFSLLLYSITLDRERLSTHDPEFSAHVGTQVRTRGTAGAPPFAMSRSICKDGTSKAQEPLTLPEIYGVVRRDLRYSRDSYIITGVLYISRGSHRNEYLNAFEINQRSGWVLYINKTAVFHTM